MAPAQTRSNSIRHVLFDHLYGKFDLKTDIQSLTLEAFQNKYQNFKNEPVFIDKYFSNKSDFLHGVITDADKALYLLHHFGFHALTDKNDQGETPIAYALKQTDIDENNFTISIYWILSESIARGKQLELAGSDINTLFNLALKYKNANLYFLLNKFYTKVDSLKKISDFWPSDINETVDSNVFKNLINDGLIFEALTWHTEFFMRYQEGRKYDLKMYIDPETKENYFQLAARHGDVRAMRYLLANVNFTYLKQKKDICRDALGIAALYGHAEICRLLCNEGLSRDDYIKGTIAAFNSKHYELAIDIAKKGKLINYQFSGRSLLSHLAERGEVAHVQRLLDLGADINQIDTAACPVSGVEPDPLFWAGYRGKREVVALLVSNVKYKPKNLKFFQNLRKVRPKTCAMIIDGLGVLYIRSITLHLASPSEKLKKIAEFSRLSEEGKSKQLKEYVLSDVGKKEITPDIRDVVFPKYKPIDEVLTKIAQELKVQGDYTHQGLCTLWKQVSAEQSTRENKQTVDYFFKLAHFKLCEKMAQRVPANASPAIRLTYELIELVRLNRSENMLAVNTYRYRLGMGKSTLHTHLTQIVDEVKQILGATSDEAIFSSLTDLAKKLEVNEALYERLNGLVIDLKNLGNERSKTYHADKYIKIAFEDQDTNVLRATL